MLPQQPSDGYRGDSLSTVRILCLRRRSVYVAHVIFSSMWVLSRNLEGYGPNCCASCYLASARAGPYPHLALKTLS
ncbi:hypothetical protein HanRHA438_Chr16g0764271 [Helianthus annuus]|nr:hypothetical protein HanRHA438_Chr16g0764271 [Helianthus annuus]